MHWDSRLGCDHLLSSGVVGGQHWIAATNGADTVAKAAVHRIIAKLCRVMKAAQGGSSLRGIGARCIRTSRIDRDAMNGSSIAR